MRIWIIITTCALWSACSSSKKCQPTNTQFMDSKAEISLKLSMSEAQLVEFADQLAPDTLYQDDDLGGQDIAILVKKNGTPSLELKERTAQVTMPLSIDAKRDLGILKATAKGSLFLTLKSTVDIQKNWSWSTQTEIVGIEWVEEPKLKIMGMQISVGSMIEKYLNSNEKEITQQIDQAVADNQLLQKAIRDAQSSFERSYAVDPDRQYFVQVMPLTAGLSPFEEKSGRLFLHVNLDGKARMTSDSTALVTPVDTPSFFWIKPQVAEHNVSAHLSFEEDELRQIMEANVIGEKVELRGKKSKISAVDLQLRSGKINVKVELSGDIQGRANFSGKPSWDASKNEFEFCEADVDLDVQRGISKFLVWLGRGAAEKRILKALEDNINDEIQSRMKEINGHLKDFKVGERLKIKGDIYDYGMDPIEVVDKQLRIGVLLDVRGKLFLDELEMRVE